MLGNKFVVEVSRLEFFLDFFFRLGGFFFGGGGRGGVVIKGEVEIDIIVLFLI